MNGARRWRAVVFDFDGTLLDSLTFVLAAIRHALEPFGGRPTMEIFASLGGPPERFFASLVEDAKHVPVAVRRLAAYHRDHARLITPYAGARELLDRLRHEGVAIGLWTGRDRVSAEWLLRENGLAAHIGAAVFGDDLPSHKPDPAGLREILQRLEVKPDETLFVGDADVDVLGGAACGVETFLIQHARTIEPAIARRAASCFASPREAFQAVLARLDNIS